jgi:hypothetical protein
MEYIMDVLDFFGKFVTKTKNDSTPKVTLDIT